MLINCPECGKEISDKAEKCIHCGYPIKKDIIRTIKINGKDYDAKSIYDAVSQYQNKSIDKNTLHKYVWTTLVNYNCISPKYINILGEKICNTLTIPESFNGQTMEEWKEEESKPHCPKCNSTSIQMVPRKWSFFAGFATNKVDRVCMNCKHKW